MASVPASYTDPTCQSDSFTWTSSVGGPACSLPKPPGELCLSSLLEMPQCVHQIPWRVAFPPERPHKLLSQDSGGRSWIKYLVFSFLGTSSPAKNNEWGSFTWSRLSDRNKNNFILTLNYIIQNKTTKYIQKSTFTFHFASDGSFPSKQTPQNYTINSNSVCFSIFITLFSFYSLSA